MYHLPIHHITQPRRIKSNDLTTNHIAQPYHGNITSHYQNTTTTRRNGKGWCTRKIRFGMALSTVYRQILFSPLRLPPTARQRTTFIFIFIYFLIFIPTGDLLLRLSVSLCQGTGATQTGSTLQPLREYSP